MLNYTFDNSNLCIVFTNNVLAHFAQHQQLRVRDKEAGGQLFARFEENQTLIEIATGPRLTDKRTRHSYQPDRNAEQVEILELFKEGLHYVGDWHTHPSTYPSASGTDIFNIHSSVVKSSHELIGFLMVIVGTGDFPNGLQVSLHTKENLTILQNK